MQAACTASLRLAALGSHQNMWQVKSLGPSAMMKAKVWTSFPTPMKDRKRTLHSDSTSSSWGEKRITRRRINLLDMIQTFSQRATRYLFRSYCEGSWCNIDMNWDPVVFDSAAHCRLQCIVDDIHTCRNNYGASDLQQETVEMSVRRCVLTNWL